MSATEAFTTSTERAVDTSTREAVLGLAATALDADGVSALDDQVRLDLAASDDQRQVLHLVVRSPAGAVLGYAHLDLRSESAGSAHVVVAPDQRRNGIGTALIEQLGAATSGRTLRLWSHGDLPAASALAQKFRFERVRDLWQMRLSLDTPIADPTYPPDVSVRTLEPGRDDEAWVAVNAAAFAHHLEQGRMTVDDLRQRMAQPWFEQAGFFVAERGSEMLGFHWTKIADEGAERLGEVYVVGVHPDAQGLGLGKALTLTGLHYLRAKDLDVTLFVDADNAAAVAVYQHTGFVTTRVDVMYECS